MHISPPSTLGYELINHYSKNRWQNVTTFNCFYVENLFTLTTFAAVVFSSNEVFSVSLRKNELVNKITRGMCYIMLYSKIKVESTDYACAFIVSHVLKCHVGVSFVCEHVHECAEGGS